MTVRSGDALAVLALLSLPLAVALGFSSGPHQVTLNLGPGDSPYISGFTPRYEVENAVGVHWSTHHAGIELPLRVRGPLALRYRFSRPLPEPADVQVRLGGQLVDAFPCTLKRAQERTRPVGQAPWTDVSLELDAEGGDGQNLGLLLDRVSVEVGEGGAVRLSGFAVWRPALLVALVFLLLRGTGWSASRAAALAAPASLAAAFGLWRDPWVTHRLLTGFDLALPLFGLAALGLGWWLRASNRASADDVRAVTGLALAAFLIRALAVNHPDFYHPDLRTHATLAEMLRRAGLRFLLTPAAYIWEHGVWRVEAHGRTYAFPYTPAFHLPFALLPVSYDALITAMKLGAAALSTIPLVLVWALARRVGASVLGAGLMVLIPTYTSRLAFAFLPSLLGHAADMGLIYWLAGHLNKLRKPRTWLTGALLVSASQLAYISGVLNTAVFVLALAVLDPLVRGEDRGRQCLRILSMGLLGALLSVLLYYRGFLPMVFDLAARIASGEPGTASRYPVQSFFAVATQRTESFFGLAYPVLALIGLVLLLRRREAPGLLLAWLAAYGLLLLGRARLPDIFLHGHETLFVTPLVCLSAGEALRWLAGTGGVRRWAASALVLALAVQGLARQWQAIADQLGHAR